jgi:hypothetical protein
VALREREAPKEFAEVTLLDRELGTLTDEELLQRLCERRERLDKLLAGETH